MSSLFRNGNSSSTTERTMKSKKSYLINILSCYSPHSVVDNEPSSSNVPAVGNDPLMAALPIVIVPNGGGGPDSV
jgi:hypothetical protein